MQKDPSFLRQQFFVRDSQGKLSLNEQGHPILNRVWQEWFASVVASQVTVEELLTLSAFRDIPAPDNKEELEALAAFRDSRIGDKNEISDAQLVHFPDYQSKIEDLRVLLAMRESLPDASQAQRGAVNIVDQKFRGRKLFEALGVSSLVWDDSQGAALGLRDTGVHVPILTQVGTTGIWLPKFTIDDVAVFAHQFRHTMAESANVTISPHVHWFGSTTDAVHAVKWELTYQWVNPVGGVIAAGSTVITVTDHATALTCQISDPPDVTQAGMLVSSLFLGQLRRITNGGTEYTGDVFLVFFDIHFQSDGLGSDTELAKTWPS